MNWRSHVLIGATITLVLLYLLGVKDAATLAMFGIIGGASALVPDLDHEMGKGKQMLDVLFAVFAIATAYAGECKGIVCIPGLARLSSIITVAFAMIGAYFLLFRFFKPRHRGITHTIVASLVFGGLVYLVGGVLVAVAGFVGYVSHLVADKEIKII